MDILRPKVTKTLCTKLCKILAGWPTRTSASPTAGQIPMLVGLGAGAFFLSKVFFLV